ncbi:protein lifeguard 1-like [Aphidius gifuensis]|uniref:protein lifeguard 1-like n=1 Tax=Aphidius gifuensis TaxID=684658 RepID=UPI001CDB66B6|nr:protein lifeguard 1-like [Aphidius gifuensis]
MSSKQSSANDGHPDQPGSDFVPQPSPKVYSTSDPAQNEVKGFDFTEKSIRLGFIRKVYALLISQLLLTFGIVAFFFFHPATNSYVNNNRWLIFVALGVIIVTLISISCCSNIRRKTPMNYIFLFIFTGAYGFFIGVISSLYSGDKILLVFGITIVLCFCLTIFAFQTKWDFTGLNTVLFVCLIVLFIACPLAIYFSLYTLIGCGSLGALLSSFVLIFDTQLMMNGKHKYSISPEEYVFATLTLYTDVISIFLSVLGGSRG